MKIVKDIFKKTGALKPGYRVSDDLTISIIIIESGGIKQVQAMKSSTEQWTIWDSPCIIWRLSQAIGEIELAQRCGMSHTTLKVQRYCERKSVNLFTILEKIESEIKGEMK